MWYSPDIMSFFFCYRRLPFCPVDLCVETRLRLSDVTLIELSLLFSEMVGSGTPSLTFDIRTLTVAAVPYVPLSTKFCF